MREFTFKPAPVRKPQIWAIKDGHLMQRGGDAALDLAKVTEANWGEISYRGSRNTWLHLSDLNGVTKLECNDLSDGRVDFLNLISGVTDELAQVNPNLQIKIGYVGAARISLFIIAVLGVLAGLFFVWAGLTGNVKRGEMQAVIFGLAFAGVLFVLGWKSRPWGQAEYLSPADLGVLVGEAKRSPV